MELRATETDSSIAWRPADFATLTDALDYAATGRTGMNFHAGRGQLLEVEPYAAIADAARETGARLIARGLEPGDRVGLIAETDADFVRAFMGCLYAHLVPCPMPLPAAFGSREAYHHQIRRIADVARPRAVLTPAMLRDWIVEGLGDRNLAFLGTVADLDNAADLTPMAPASPDETAYLQFSSGTTNFPKGIEVSHRAMMTNVRVMAIDALEMKGEDRGVSWLPFYHDMGLVGCMLLPIAAQLSIDYYATRDFVRRPGLWLELISRNRGTMSYAPSFGYDLAARRARLADGLDLSCWRVAGIGGDMIKTTTLDAFAETFGPKGFRAESFLPSYGMAEATLGLTFAPLGRGCEEEVLDLARLGEGRAEPAAEASLARRSFAVCGRVLPGHEIEIRDGHGSALPERRIGRIFARGPSLMSGYFGDPAATAEAISPDGWLDTGDLGYLRGGELVVTGRAKDLMIVNGRNIWPQDIEWAIERQVNGTREGGVAAFGVPVDGADSGAAETVTIIAECREQRPDARAELKSRLHALARENFGVEAVIGLASAGQLPRTSSGKLSRAKARELFLAGAFEL